MPTDRDMKCQTGHPINGSRVERARYFIALSRWARGGETEVNDQADASTNISSG
jgi:hypothetical protein